MADPAGNQLPPGWLEVLSDEGELYFWNEITNETTWERPAMPKAVPQKPHKPQKPTKPGFRGRTEHREPQAAVPKGDVGAALAVAYPDGLPETQSKTVAPQSPVYQPAPLVSSNPAVAAALAAAFPDGVPPAVQPRTFPAPLAPLGGPAASSHGGPVAATGTNYPVPAPVSYGGPVAATGARYPVPAPGGASGGYEPAPTGTAAAPGPVASSEGASRRGMGRSHTLDVEAETAAFIDAEYTEEEGRERALTLQILTEGVILSSDRWCVKEGSLYKSNRNGRKMYQFFLYNDAFIYAEVSSLTRKYTVKREIPLTNVRVEESDEDEPIGYCFRLMSTEKSFIVECMNEHQKESWVKMVASMQKRQGIDAQELERKVMAPIFVHNADAADCMICGKAFGLLNRRHHCKKCGKCICNSCSYDKMRVPGLETHGRLVRCCIPCGNDLKKNRSYGSRRAW